MKIKLLSFLASAALLLSGGTAFAAPPAPAQMSGTALAKIVTPGSVVPIRDLRFGQFLQPSAAGTLTISPTSTATPTAGMVGNIGIPQLAPGRGAGGFNLKGSAGRAFVITLPSSANITSGSASMTVNTFRANTLFGGFGVLNSTGNYTLNVGARLNVGAGQAVGNYVGTYTVTVLFL